VAAGTALVMADLSFHGGIRSGPRRAPSCAPSWTASPSAACAPTSAPSWSSWSSTTPIGRRGGRYRNLTPATDYNVDYAMLASTRMEPLLRDIRLGMDGAGMYCEGVKGECNLGQQEIAFRYDERWSPVTTTPSTRTAPRRSPISTEVADLHGEIR
jgi:glutamine synthetase